MSLLKDSEPPLAAQPSAHSVRQHCVSLLMLLMATLQGSAETEIVLPPLNPPPPSKTAPVGPDLPSTPGFPSGSGLPELKPPPSNPKAGSGLPSGLAASGLSWHNNPYTAMNLARGGDKYLLILFGAWSWNPTSETLCWELFATKEFKEYSSKWLNLAYIDFPQRKNDTHRKALEFKEAYEVRGYPAVVLVDPETGAFWEKSGFRKGTARAYLEEIQEAISTQNAERYTRRELWIKRGFRQWSGVDGKNIFAKLVGKGSDGELRFIDRGGQQFEVNPDNLSEQDQLLIPYFLPEE